MFMSAWMGETCSQKMRRESETLHGWSLRKEEEEMRENRENMS